MGIAGLWPLLKSAAVHVDSKAIAITDLHYDVMVCPYNDFINSVVDKKSLRYKSDPFQPSEGLGTGSLPSHSQQRATSSQTAADLVEEQGQFVAVARAIPVHQAIKDLAKKIFDDTLDLFPQSQSITFHMDGYTKESEHSRRAKKRKVARQHASNNLIALEKKFEGGKWTSKALPDKLYRDLRKTYRLSNAQKQAFCEVMEEYSRARIDLSSDPLLNATRITRVCLCSTEADTCMAFCCLESDGSEEPPADLSDDLKDRTVVVTKDSDLIMYYEVKTVFRPNPAGSYFFRYRKDAVKQALEFTEDSQLTALAIVSKNDYSFNFAGFGLRRNGNIIRDFDPAVVKARQERQEERKKKAAERKNVTSKEKSAKKATAKTKASARTKASAKKASAKKTPTKRASTKRTPTKMASIKRAYTKKASEATNVEPVDSGSHLASLRRTRTLAPPKVRTKSKGRVSPRRTQVSAWTSLTLRQSLRRQSRGHCLPQKGKMNPYPADSSLICCLMPPSETTTPIQTRIQVQA